MRYKNNRLQILHLLKSDSDAYFCSATNVLGSVERKTLLVVVSLPRFTVKPLARVSLSSGETLTLNCSANGDPQPIISWRKQGGQLPAGRSQQSNGDLVIRGFQMSDTGYYICAATSAGVFAIETGTYTEIRKGMLLAGSGSNPLIFYQKTVQALNFSFTVLGSRRTFCRNADQSSKKISLAS